jgi:hypothetical protein
LVPAVAKTVEREAVAEANVLEVPAVGTSVAVHGGVPHVENVTVPDGPAPRLCVVMVAVKTTACPAVAVLRLVESPVVVVAFETVTVSVTGVATGL